MYPTLEEPQPGSAQRNTNIGAPRQGISESLGAPGLAPLPAVSRGASMAEQLERALGIAGREVANIVNRAAHEKQRIDIAERGLGYRDGNGDAAELIDKVVNRELLLPDGSDPSEFAS